MDIYTWIVFLYVAGTALLAWLLVHELMYDSLYKSVFYPKKKEARESLNLWHAANNTETLAEKLQWGNYEDVA